MCMEHSLSKLFLACLEQFRNVKEMKRTSPIPQWPKTKKTLTNTFKLNSMWQFYVINNDGFDIYYISTCYIYLHLRSQNSGNPQLTMCLSRRSWNTQDSWYWNHTIRWQLFPSNFLSQWYMKHRLGIPLTFYEHHLAQIHSTFVWDMLQTIQNSTYINSYFRSSGFKWRNSQHVIVDFFVCWMCWQASIAYCDLKIVHIALWFDKWGHGHEW